MQPFNNSWHNISESNIVDLLQTNFAQGLSSTEVQQRLSKFGLNELTQKKQKSALYRFALQFTEPLVYLLLAAAIITAWIGKTTDSSVIFIVVLINAIVGYFQETKALKALEALSKSIHIQARVVRESKTKEIPAHELVPGDIVVLRSGDKVPADLRLIHVNELRINESMLTGESLPVQKVKKILDKNTILADRLNLAYASTLVTHGQGTGVVIATGNNTELGNVSKLILETEQPDSPLTIKIKHFSKILLYIILALASVTFFVGILRGQPVADTFLATVALAIAAIPEGLPAALTIIQAIGVSRMASRHAIIRKLPAVETLGCTTIICTDKTGTLTENRMTVQEIYAGERHFKLTGTGYVPVGEIFDSANNQKTKTPAPLKECLLAGLLCNDSILVQKNDQWEIEGDPTEGALLVSARKAGLTEEEYSQKLEKISTIPFESVHQYMATLHTNKDSKAKVAYIKGSVESVLLRCTTHLSDSGKEIPINHDFILNQVLNMASHGMRVLAFARKKMPQEIEDLSHKAIESGLTFLGLQAMIDPPRQEVIDAIAACHFAGITVKMITGDHPVTAAAIAQKINLDGLGNSSHLKVITGTELSNKSDEEFSKLVNQSSVFARVSPEEKLRLVRALQSQNHVVAMTGDGVNDAPALKQANIGIAMGKTGTEVSKEAADMVLTDDNFTTIKAAIEEGRCVFDNLTKFIIWTLPTNIGQAILLITSIIFGLELPLLPVQILWINMNTVLLLGLTLAFEQKEPNIMRRKPRNVNIPILTKPLLFRTFFVSSLMTFFAFILYELEIDQGSSTDTARTVVANTIVMIDVFYLLNCRSISKSMFAIGLFSNKSLLFGIIGIIGVQLAFTYLPLFNKLFHTTPISINAWIEAIIVGFIIYAIIGLEKWLFKNYHLTTT